MKKLLFISLISFNAIIISQGIHAKHNQREEECVKNFIKEVKSGGKTWYNDILACFGSSSIRKLASKDFEMVVDQAVKESYLPYSSMRIRLDTRDAEKKRGEERLEKFLAWLNQQRPILSTLNDLYLRNGKIFDSDSKNGSNYEPTCYEIKSAIGAVDNILRGEGYKGFEGLADKYVNHKTNHQELKVLKRRLAIKHSIKCSDDNR